MPFDPEALITGFYCFFAGTATRTYRVVSGCLSKTKTIQITHLLFALSPTLAPFFGGRSSLSLRHQLAGNDICLMGCFLSVFLHGYGFEFTIFPFAVLSRQSALTTGHPTEFVIVHSSTGVTYGERFPGCKPSHQQSRGLQPLVCRSKKDGGVAAVFSTLWIRFIRVEPGTRETSWPVLAQPNDRLIATISGRFYSTFTRSMRKWPFPSSHGERVSLRGHEPSVRPHDDSTSNY